MKLVCIEGENKAHVWQLTGKSSVIGRDPHCDIVIEDPMLSRVHAEVICEGDSLIFKDNDSLNGSYINNVRVTSQVLFPGDVIKLGDTRLKTVEEDLPQEACWQEHDPFVTSAISLDHLTEQAKEAVSWAKRGKGRRGKKSEERGLNAPKLIKNLKTIYEVGTTLNSIRNLDEMLEQVGKRFWKSSRVWKGFACFLGEKMGTLALNPKSSKPEMPLNPGLFGSAEASFRKQSKIKSASLHGMLLAMSDLLHRRA